MFRLLLVLLLASPAVAGQAVKSLATSSPAAVLPVAKGPVLTELKLQLGALNQAQTPAQLKSIFASQIAPTPVGKAATPAAFAARAAIVQILAQPQTIPALKASLEATGGKKAESVLKSLENVEGLLAGAPVKRAVALHKLFDGTSAAPGEAVDLALMPTTAPGPKGKKALKKLEKENERIRDLQEKLVAENRRSYLEMIQAIDTAGKDGVVKHGHRVNSAWDDVTAFKKPTKEEAAEDYKARINRALPMKRHTGVHIRTIYEDVIMPLLLKTLPAEVVEARFSDILRWELGLMGAGTTVRKVFLNVTKKVQRERLQARIDDPEKHWKFDPNDLKTREMWDQIQQIYGAVLARTSTIFAPWEIIGANDKNARNLAYAKGTRKALERMDPRYPENPELYKVKIPK